MKNFTRLLLVIILASGWQGLFAQSFISQQTFGTTSGAITTLSGWTLVGTETGYTTATLDLASTSAASSSSVYSIFGQPASLSMDLNDISTTNPSTATYQCTGNFSAVGYTNIVVDFAYRYSSAYTGNLTIAYRIGSSGGFTTFTGYPAAIGTGSPAPLNAVASTFAVAPALALPVGANGASEIDFQITFDRTHASGNFEIDDLTLGGTPSTPTITITPGTLSLYAQQPSTLQEGTYTVSGVNLTSSVTINPPSGVLIGTTSGGESSSPITLTNTGTLAATTIYVELSGSDAVGAFASANITNAATGATTQNVGVSGTVFAAASAFTPGNIVGERVLTGGVTVLDEYTSGGTLVQTIPMPFTTSPFFDGTSSSEGLDELSVDGQYIIATGYSSSTTDAGTLPTNPRKFARIKYDGTIDNSTSINDATATAGNMRNAASIDGSGFWLGDNNGTSPQGNPNIYQSFGATSGESYFQGTGSGSAGLGSSPLTNTRGIGIFDGSIYASVKSTLYKIPGTPTSNAPNATVLSGFPGTTEGNSASLGFVMFDVNPAIPGPDVMYVADLGGNYTKNTAYSTNTSGTYGVFKYVYNGTTWESRGHIEGPASGLTGQVVGNDVVLYAIVNAASTTDTIYTVTDIGAGNASTYTNTISNNNIAFAHIPGSFVAASATGTDYMGVTFAPVQVSSAPTVTNTTGTSVSQNMLYLTNNNLLYQFSMVNNSVTTPAFLTGATFTPSGTYSTSNLSAFTLFYNTDGTFDTTAFQVGYATPTASGTSFTFNTGFSLAPSATGYFYVCANIANSGNGNTVIINAPVDGNFTFTDGGSATGGTYTGGGTNTIVPSQQVYASVSSVSGLYTTVGSSSPWLGFDASGLNLNLGSETITLTTGTNVEISIDSTNWFNSSNGNSITLTPVGEVVASTRVVVRIRNSAPAGAVSDVITLASTGANNVTVSVSGYVGKPFTSGDILVSRTGTGVGVLSSSATPVFLDEYTTSGTLVQSIPLPTFENGLNKICTQSGTASTVDLDHLSLDGQYFLSTGFDAPVGMAKLTSTHNSTWSARSGGVANRVVARIKYDATINTTTYLTDAYDSNLIRSAASIDGSSFYVSGRSNDTYAGADGGARWINLGANTSTSLSTSANVETRNISIIASQLYASTSTSPNIGINAIGTGVNNVSGQTYTPLISSLTSSSITPYGYVGFASDTSLPGVDIMYIADQTNGIYKYAQDAQGVWNSYGQLTGSANGITGKIVGTNVVLYIVSGARGTSGNTVYTITDPIGHANIAGNGTALTTAGTLIATAATNTTFGSLDFVPVALGGTPSVAISSPGPAAGGILPGTSHDVVYQLNMTASVANAIVTSVTLTTGGTYTSSDLTASAFELWYSSNGIFDTTAIEIAKDAFVASGGNVVFDIAQPIAVGKTAYFYFTVNAKSGAAVGDNVFVTATPSANIILADNGSVTGSAALGGTQTIDACLNSGGEAYAGGGSITNPNTVICSGTSASMGLHTYIGTVQWQQSADGETNWTNVTGGTGGTVLTQQTTAVYITPTLTTTTYYRALVTNSCFVVASNTVIVYVSAAPTVTLTNVTPTSVSASWTPFAVNSSVLYTLTYSGSAGSGTINPANSPQAINGLTSGSTLDVTVNQVNPAGCTTSSNASINTTLAAPTLTLGTATAHGFTASWTTVPGATSYTLYYRSPNINGGFSTITTSASPVVLTGLNIGTFYLAYVTANEAGYTGTASTEQYITTLPNSNSCATPTFSVASNCSNQLTITMSGSPSGIYRFSIIRISPNPSAGASYTVSGGTVNVTVGSQFASSIWQVLVSSNCSGVISEIADPQYVVIKPACPALQNLVLSTPDNCHGFEATWNAGTCISPENYYLFVQRQGTVGYVAYPVGTNNYVNASWLGAYTWNAYITQVGCNTTISPASTIQTINTGVGCRTEEQVQADNTPINDVEQGNAAMNIYPNPTNGNFMVNVYTKNKPDETIQIEMVNTLGQVVFTVIAPVTNGISNNAFQVPGNVSSGMYIIRTVAGGENLTKQVIFTK